MAYLVLARKWRPQGWDEIVAQQHVTATLRNAIQHNRLAHAYLFTGPRGVGKTSAARILAKALNCEKGPTVQPCNTCSSCTEITESRNMDVLEIDGASNRGIEDVRNLRESVRYTPVSGKYKVYIIDEVHMLTNEAFNALLKTLEEPPSHALFVFATTEPQKVPATIVSRCQRFDFHRASIQDIVTLLKRVALNECIQVDDDALLLIAKKSDGSLRDSESILDQIVSFTSGKITATEVVQALGMIDQEVYFHASDAITAKDVTKSLDLVEKLFYEGYSTEEFLSGLVEHFRNLLVVRDAGQADFLELSDTLKKQYAEKAGLFQDEDLLRLIRITADSLNSLKQGIPPRFVLELAFIKMSKLDKTVALDDLLSSLSRLSDNGACPPEGEAKPGKLVSNPQAKKEENPPASTPADTPHKKEADSGNPISLEEVQKQWGEFIQEAKAGKVTAGTFLQEGAPVAIEGNLITIGFRQCNGFHIDAIMRSEGIIKLALKKVFGRDLNFRCIKGEFAQLENAKGYSKEERFQQLKETSPAIEMLSKELGAELV